jgi:hypothetical protein
VNGSIFCVAVSVKRRDLAAMISGDASSGLIASLPLSVDGGLLSCRSNVLSGESAWAFPFFE